jgi:hypothetical protein
VQVGAVLCELGDRTGVRILTALAIGLSRHSTLSLASYSRTPGLCKAHGS